MKTQIQTRIGLAMALTLVLFAGLAPRAGAQDFVWKGATAAWNTDAQWNPAASAADYANAAKTFLVTNGTVQSVDGGTFAAQLTIRGNGDTNYSGGTLAWGANHTATVSNWHLDGGRFYYNAGNNATINGALTVDSDSVWDIASDGKGMTFNASIAGSGGLKVKVTTMQVNLSAASSSYSGRWTILPSAGRLNTGAANCLGTGWVDVQSGGALGLKDNVSLLTGSGIVVRAGGSLAVEGNATASIRMQGGLLGELDASGSSYSLGGSIYLDAPSTLKTPGNNGKTLTINAPLYGTNSITVTNFAGTTTSEIILGVDNSGTYTGAWNVVGCILNGNAANAFGVSTVTATNGTVVKVNGNQHFPIYMKTGSTFTVTGPNYGTCTTSNLYVDGATIESAVAGVTLAGNIRVDGASTLRGKVGDPGKTFDVSAQFWGTKRMTLNNPAGNGNVNVTGSSGATFSGGWTVQAGTLYLKNALGLGDGTGPLTIAAAGPNLYYEAAYTVTNSALTLGTDTFAAGTYSITNTYVSDQANSVAFTNFFTRKAGVNDGWVVVRSLEPLPTITNAAPTNVTTSTAWLNGGLVSNGWAAASVSVGWDTTDRGANPTWASNYTWAAPQPSPNPYSYQATGLLPDKTYYYTYSASNANNKVGWATPSKSFITGGLTVQATDAMARTSAVDTATFTVTRPVTCTNEDLQVFYTLGGTATNVTDYSLDKASGSVILTKGQTNGTIVLTPVWKVDVERTVTLTLAPGPYATGSPASAQCTLAAHEFDFVWEGGTANWRTGSAWNPDATAGDISDVSKVFLATNGTLQTGNGESFSPLLIMRGNGDTNAFVGATLALGSGNTITADRWHLDGGRFAYNAGAGATVNGALTVDSDSVWDIASDGKTMTFNASIAGSGGLKVKANSMQVNVSAASSAYSGLWTILSAGGRLNAVAANVLGTGWVDVLSGGSLGLLNSASTLTGSGIVVRAGASLSLEGDSTATIRMQGGTFGTLAAISGYYTLGGSIYVDAPSTFQTPGSDGKWITVNSTLYGTGGIVVTNFAGAPNSYFDLTVDSSGTYTGAWTVVGGQLKGSAANAFGAGTVTATTGALVRVGASQTAPVFTMGTGSVFNAEWGGTATIGSLHVAGATIGSDLNSKTLAGSIYVDGPSTLRGYGSDAGRTFTISAPFYGSQPMTFNHTGGAPGPVYITGNSGSTFSGGWTVSNGTLQLQNALGLGDGTGPLTIAAAGPKLYYEAAYTVTNSALTLGTDTFADGTYSITNTYVSRQANSVAFTNFFTRKAGVNDGWVVVKGLPSGTVFKFR